MEVSYIFSALKKTIAAIDTDPADALMAFGIFYKDLSGNENVLFLENTSRQTTKMSAHSAKYPTELGYNQTEFKYKEPNEVRIVGLISRKGTGLAGYNFSISSLALKNPLQSKSKLIKGTRKDLDFLIKNQVLCEVWALNGGKRNYMTLTGAEIHDDLRHVGLFEVDLTFVEVQELILEPEPMRGAFAKKISSGVCQVVAKEV